MAGNVAGNTMHKGFNRQPRAFMPLMPGFFSSTRRSDDNPDIPNNPDSLFTTRSRSLSVWLVSLAIHAIAPKIDIPAAGTHHQAFQRRHAHRGVHAVAVAYRTNRRAVAKMSNDQPAIPARVNQAAPAHAEPHNGARCRGNHSDARPSAGNSPTAGRKEMPLAPASDESWYQTPPPCSTPGE